MDKVLDVSYMFDHCQSLTSIIYWKFGINSIINMSYMFNNDNMEYLDLSNLNTTGVQDMTGIFSSTSYLKSINFGNFDTSKVTTMESMFYHCSALESLDLSSFNTEVVINMDKMFHSCTSLLNLNVSSLNTNKVNTMNYMFGMLNLEYYPHHVEMY